MAASEPDTSIFEPPEDIADQHVTPLPMACFERLDSLMAEGKGPNWPEYIRRGSPTTGRGYWAWDRLTFIQRHVKDAPQAPDFTKQTIHLLYKGDDFQIAVKGASRMVDKVCHGENGGEEAKKVEGDARKYLIPACVAIIRTVFERAGGQEGLGSFTKVTLEVIMRALDWAYKLVAVAGDGDGWKGRLEEALEPLAGGVLVAMRRIREMEAGIEEGREESKDGDESVVEEKGRGEAASRDDGLEEAENTAEEGDLEESDGEESNEAESSGELSSGQEIDGEERDEAESAGEVSSGKESNVDESIGNESNVEGESMEEAGRMEEDESMGGVVCTVEEPLEEEHLLEAYSQSGYEPGLDSESDYSVTTAQATRRNGRRTRRQAANFSSQDKNRDDAIERVETRTGRKQRADTDEYDSPPPPKRLCRRGTSPRTRRWTTNLSSQDKNGDAAIKGIETRANRKRRADADEYDSPPPPKRPCRRGPSPRTPTDSEELTGPKMRLRRGSSIQVEGPRRSARVKKLQEPQKPKKDGPKKDVGKLGIPTGSRLPSTRRCITA